MRGTRMFSCMALFGALLLPLFVHAHATGPSLEKRIGKYLMDVGYNMFDPVAGQEVLFDTVLIQDPDTFHWSIAPYQQVRVEIGTNQEEAPFVHEVTLDRPIRILVPYTFPHEGRYEINVRFSGTGGVVAEASFPIDIGDASDWWSTRRISAMIGLVLLVMGMAGVGYVLFFPRALRT